MKLSEIKDILKAKVITGDDKMDLEVLYGAASDLMSDLLVVPRQDVVLLTGLTSVQVIKSSVIAGVSAVVLVRAKSATEDMIKYAQKHDLPLLSTPFTMFTTCGRLLMKGLKGVELKEAELKSRSA